MKFDVIIGSGSPSFEADIGIEGTWITAIGDLYGAEPLQRIDAEGRIVAPGFIDIHIHSDVKLIIDPRAESKVRQGVTTEVLGNCGTSAAPRPEKKRGKAAKADGETELPASDRATTGWLTMTDYLTALEKTGTAVNCLTLVGHGTIREKVMGARDTVPTSEQMSSMKQLIEQAMDAGAIGLSTALIYPPSSYATTVELIELMHTVSRLGGFYFTHMRGDSREAVEEVIRIARETGASCQTPTFTGISKMPCWWRRPDRRVWMSHSINTPMSPAAPD